MQRPPLDQGRLDQGRAAPSRPAEARPAELRLTDSHCHLDFPQFGGAVAALVARAAAAGVHRMVTICTHPEGEAAVRAIAEAHPAVFYAVGLHPMSVGKAPPVGLEALTAMARHPRCVGIGETGLDYHYTAETRDAQTESLRVHIEAARQTGLPLIIHARDADADMARILAEEHRAVPFGCVMHCFSSGAALAETALGLGFYLSLSGIAAFPRSDDLRAIFAAAPLDRLLVETDAPFLAPPPHRGKRNEPAFVAHTAAAGAAIFGVPLADFAAATERNFERLFARAVPEPTAEAAPGTAAAVTARGAGAQIASGSGGAGAG